MNKSIIIRLVGVLFITTSQATAGFIVDIGTSSSEAGYSLVGWGPVEPTNSNGNYGGIATDSQSNDNLCRVIWDTRDNPSASITFPNPIYSITIRHLDGQADDSFDVEVDGVYWDSYASNIADTSEWWTTTQYYGTPGTTLTLTAKGNMWSSFDTYGQVAIDRIEAEFIPAPGALLLGSIGAGFVGWLRRRRTL